MPKKFKRYRQFDNNKFNEHDDRSSESHHIRKVSRKVSFKKNFNKKPNFAEADLQGGRRNQLNQIRITANFRNELKPSDWYQVRIVYGAKYDRNTLLELVQKHLYPFEFVPCLYNLLNNDAVFYVDNKTAAEKLLNANRQITLSDGRPLIIKVRETRQPNAPVDNILKEKMKTAMARRYIAENKALDLSTFIKDPEFSSGYRCALSHVPIFTAAMKIITENIADIVALNLTGNRISQFGDHASEEFKKMKSLKILHLGDNFIKNLHMLNCLRGLDLTELTLRGNPVCNNFTEQTHFVRYGPGITEVRKRFPKLTKLDDVELPPVISFDVGEEAKLPPSQAAFMCNPEGRGVVKAFLSQYFEIYDSGNRSNLAQAYHENAFFSQCAFYPPNSNNNSVNTRLNVYFQESRNLFRVPDYPRRKSRLHIGKGNIVQYLAQLPKTQHDLSSFVVDLTLFMPTMINLSVCGIFREPDPNNGESTWPVRYFSRTFLIVPVGQGFCIVNDLLSITNGTADQVANSFKVETQNPVILQSPPTASSSLPVSPVSPQLDDAVRLQMVQSLSAQSGMNLEWSKKCLDETQWDFQRALWTFTELQKAGTIPAEAFVK